MYLRAFRISSSRSLYSGDSNGNLYVNLIQSQSFATKAAWQHFFLGPDHFSTCTCEVLMQYADIADIAVVAMDKIAILNPCMPLQRTGKQVNQDVVSSRNEPLSGFLAKPA